MRKFCFEDVFISVYEYQFSPTLQSVHVYALSLGYKQKLYFCLNFNLNYYAVCPICKAAVKLKRRICMCTCESLLTFANAVGWTVCIQNTLYITINELKAGKRASKADVVAVATNAVDILKVFAVLDNSGASLTQWEINIDIFIVYKH